MGTVKDNKNPKNEVCPFCDKGFTLKQSLNRHTKQVHDVDCSQPPSKGCPSCNAVFFTVALLNKHLAEDHGLELEKVEIDFVSLESNCLYKTIILFLFFFCKIQKLNNISIYL